MCEVGGEGIEIRLIDEVGGHACERGPSSSDDQMCSPSARQDHA